MWVENDEGLYNLWRSSGLPMRQFLRDPEHREMVDRAIKNVMDGSKPAHYLAYGN